MGAYAIVAMIIIASGSIIGWIIPGFLLIQLFVSGGYLVWKKRNIGNARINVRNFVILLVSILIMMGNILISSGIGALFSNYALFIMFLSLFFATECLDRKTYANKYVDIMCFLGAVSVIFWALSLIGIEIADTTVLAGNNVYYRLNPLYVYRSSSTLSGAQYLTRRNSGIFWEPGAHQGYLNLAIMMLLFCPEVSRKKYRMKLSVLIVSVLSTVSTTGYIVLVLVLITWYVRENAGGKMKPYVIVAGVLILIGTVLVLNSSAVKDKFSENSSSYISFLTRANDNVAGLKALFDSPLLGLGYNSERYYNLMNSLGITANSSGLLITLQQYGIFVGTFILVWLYMGMRRVLCLNGLPAVMLMGIFALLMSTESFVTKEIFAFFAFVLLPVLPGKTSVSCRNG